MAPKDVEPSGSCLQGSPGMQTAAPVPSSPVGARACVHGAALRQSHILSAPGLRWPPPARCGHGRVLRAETKATAASGPGSQQGAKLPVRTPLRAALAAQLPAEQRGDILWHLHLPGQVVAIRGGHAACPHPAPGAVQSRGGSAHPGCGKATHPRAGHPRATSYPPGGGFPPVKPQHQFFQPLFLLPVPRVAEARGAPSGTQSRASPSGHPAPALMHRREHEAWVQGARGHLGARRP